MKTGVFGGTFNPIHTGHLILAEQAYSQFKLDRVFIIPSGRSYFKDDIMMPKAEVRYEMCRLACMDNDHFRVLDIEVKRPGNSYTCETLSELKALYPEDEFYYISGEDSLAEIGSFKDPHIIFELATILVSVRPDDGRDMYDMSALRDVIKGYERDYGARIEILSTSYIDISSSRIRDHIAGGRSVRYYLPKEVEDYIAKQGLYR